MRGFALIFEIVFVVADDIAAYNTSTDQDLT